MIMSATEKLVAVAIKRGDIVESRGFQSHWKLRYALQDADPQKASPGDIEGFWTSEDRFVTRSEAVPIAIAAGQLHPRWKSAGRDILSSDINWKTP